MSRALWHNAEMQDGVKCFLAVRSQLSLVHFTMVVFGAALPLVYSTTIAPCGATELTSFAQVSSAQAGSGTACHVTMCPFAFTVDDSHTEGTGPRLPATLTGRGLRIGITCNPKTGVVITL